MAHVCEDTHCQCGTSYRSYSPPSPPTPPHGPEFCDGSYCHDWSHECYRADRKVAAVAEAKRKQAAQAELGRQQAAAAEARRQEAAVAEAKRQQAAAAEAKRQSQAVQKAQPDRKSSLGRKTSTADSRRSSADSVGSSRRGSNASMRSASTMASSISSNNGWQLKTLERTPSNKFQVELQKNALLEWKGTVNQPELAEMLVADSSAAARNAEAGSAWKLKSCTRRGSDNFDVNLEKTEVVYKVAKLSQRKLQRLLAASESRNNPIAKITK